MIEVTVNGNTLDVLRKELADFIGVTAPVLLSLPEVIDGANLQELLTAVDKRLNAEGYDVVVTKRVVKMSFADQKKEEAKAKLRGDLQASLQAGNLAEVAKVAKGDGSPEETPVKPAKSKINGNGSVDATKRKLDCLIRLKALYDSGRKADVNKILADHGGGAKNFAQVPEENFEAINTALEALA